MKIKFFKSFAISLITLSVFLTSVAEAKNNDKHIIKNNSGKKISAKKHISKTQFNRYTKAKKAISTHTYNPQSASLVINGKTGEILHAENAHEKRFPASLTKMMTIYIAFQQIKSNRLKMSDKIYISERAAAQSPSKMYLRPGEYITVKDALLCLIVKSANDIAVAMAEKIAGSEENFASLMNVKAKQLGLNSTNFINASGLHNPHQYTNAFDMAKLAVATKRDFPGYYNLFSKTNFIFKNKQYKGHNSITANYPGADGGKTGFICASGFNLITTAQRSGTKLVGVVLGGPTARHRDTKMASLLDTHFEKFQKPSTQTKIVNLSDKKYRKYIGNKRTS